MWLRETPTGLDLAGFVSDRRDNNIARDQEERHHRHREYDMTDPLNSLPTPGKCQRKQKANCLFLFLFC